MDTKRLTVAQATIEYLKNQYVERDGVQNKFFAGCFGILGMVMLQVLDRPCIKIRTSLFMWLEMSRPWYIQPLPMPK